MRTGPQQPRAPGPDAPAGTGARPEPAAADPAEPGPGPGRPSLREAAATMFGAERVAAEWHADGPMRARLRRRLCRDAGDAEPGRGPSGP